jgi:hypothetical protein
MCDLCMHALFYTVVVEIRCLKYLMQKNGENNLGVLIGVASCLKSTVFRRVDD